MHVANQELCHELNELSGWDATDYLWTWAHQGPNTEYNDDYDWEVELAEDGDWRGVLTIPAYDLGYLLRKLNEFRPDVTTSLYVGGTDTKGNTKHTSAAYKAPYRANADTPEDAACKLCIELFKQGVLSKEDKP